MSNLIPQFFYDKRIYDYVKSLVSMGAKDYRSLLPTIKDKIVVKIIEVLGTDADDLFYGGDNYDSLLNKFTKFLTNSSGASTADVMEQLRNNSHIQYQDDLDELFFEIIESNENSIRREAGLLPYVDKQNGEITWRRSA